MINIGIDVHKKRCVATFKGSSRHILQQITFDNNSAGMAKFIDSIKQRHDTAWAVRKSTANYWIRLIP